MEDQLSNISRLEKDLWEAADNLRANSKLTSSEYCMPVLGVIFLRHAANRFDAVTKELETAQSTGKMPKRKLMPQDYVKRRSLWLPEEARYDNILGLSSGADLGEALINAMDKIEESFEPLAGVLPKDYTIFERTVLEDLLRVFDRDALKQASGDVFGRIYEYFLMKFAMQGAQDNGEFFTPPSLVQTIVNVIEPSKGKVLDPAVGSAGMFVQSSHFVEQMGQDTSHNLTFYGQEKTATTIRLAKMNLAVHGLEGDIREANTFYEDVHSLVGKCDYVMANPPFNVDMVDAEKIKGDVRLPFGLPGINAKKKVGNGNYLWIQYFYSYLNKKGRSGFVMASSASDSGGDDKVIRQKLVDTGHVDVMIAIGTNFFYTRTLPCTLWFFDKAKPKALADRILMIDASKIHRKVTRVINDFSPEQLNNIAAIVWLHRGETDRYLGVVRSYLVRAHATAVGLTTYIRDFDGQMSQFIEHLQSFEASLSDRNEEESESVTDFRLGLSELQNSWKSFGSEKALLLDSIQKHSRWVQTANLATNENQRAAHAAFEPVSGHIRSLRKTTERVIKAASSTYDIAIKSLNAAKSESWKATNVRSLHKSLIRIPKDDENDNLRHTLVEAFSLPPYFQRQANWLQSKFPEARFANIEGLCNSTDRETITSNDCSLTPGRFVGVSPAESDPDFDFEERIGQIQAELKTLNEQASGLATTIEQDFAELLG